VTAPTAVMHYPRCFGCGTANAGGLKLEAHWDGSELRIEHSAPIDSEGGPGVVHGGYVASLVDEAMALTASAFAGTPAMTRRVELDYLAPTLIESPIEITARVAETGARKIVIELTARSLEHGYECFSARGVYIRVPPDKWIEQMRAKQRTTTKLDFAGGDPSNYFRWQTQGLQSVFVADRVAREVTVAVVIDDVTPPEWTFAATRHGLEVSEGRPEHVDATFHGSFTAWQDYTHDERALADLVDAGRARVDGDPAALDVFVGCLDFGTGHRDG